MFGILLDDDKIVDLVTVFGDDFPIAGNVLALKIYSDDSNLSLKKPQTPISSEPSTAGKSYGQTSNTQSETVRAQGSETFSQAEEMVSAQISQENRIQIILEPHEGKETSSSPFSVHPKQMVCA